ncbi:MBL fold metallo-hydrolase [Rhodococcus koreensis]|uniref:MBL fold metallo-hydrolase n=1 Tax=Rhodococcus koreensis TaxID=99653 RepID=UPI00366AF364
MVFPSTGANDLRAEVFIGPFLPFEQGGGTFAATTSTLVNGTSEAVLIDAQHIRADVAALAEFIGRTGKRLTTIYVTHGHADHWYGAGDLLATFPDARVVATAPVVEYINHAAESETQQWAAMFGERVAKPSAVPEVLDGLTIELEGHQLQIVEVGQGDIHPSTVVHIPDLDAVVAGDVVYNQIHAMLGLSGPEGWERWLQSLDAIEKLSARMIVAGHRKPESSDYEASRMLDETRSYISDFAEGAQRLETADELVQSMRSKYPDFGNRWTLHFSAQSWFSRKKQA